MAAPLVIPAPSRAPRRPAGVSRPVPAPPRFAPTASAAAFVAPAAAALAAAPNAPAVLSHGPDLRMRVRPEARPVRLAGASITAPRGDQDARFVVPSGAGAAITPVPGVVTPGLRAA